jgi:hypothetical protein
MSNIIELGKKSFDLSSLKKTPDNNSIDDKQEINEDIQENNDNDIDIFKEMYLNQMETQKPILTPEEAKFRREKIIKIQRYIHNFENLLMEFKSIDLSSKSTEELENYLEEIRLIVNNKNSNNILVIGYNQGLGVIESMSPYLNMDLQGLSAICSRDQAINDCLKEISIEYLNSKYMKPTYRLAILTAGIALKLNSVNKSNVIINNYLDKKLDNDLEDKYNDI